MLTNCATQYPFAGKELGLTLHVAEKGRLVSEVLELLLVLQQQTLLVGDKIYDLDKKDGSKRVVIYWVTEHAE